MKGVAFLLAVTGFAAASSATAGEFRPLAFSLVSDFYVDTQSVDVRGTSRSATVLLVRPDPLADDAEVEMRRMEFDCTAPRTRVVSTRSYTYDMVLVGETRARGPWETFGEGTVSKVLWGYVCQGDIPEGADSETYRTAQDAVRLTLEVS
jgi:hypothetical protein